MNYYPLEKQSLLYNGYRRGFQLNGLSLLLIHEEGKSHLIENRCPHMDWSLDNASVKGGVITCTKHRIGFQLSSGRASAPMSLDCLRVFDLILRGDEIGVDPSVVV